MNDHRNILSPNDQGISLVAQSLTHGFDGFGNIFENLNFSIASGDFITMLGPSGCGKSTVLRILAGLETPSRGAVKLNRTLPAGKFGFVFQEPTLLPWRTVEENVSVPLEILGFKKEEMKIRAHYWLGQVGFTGPTTLRPAELSGGMKMRVSLARALVTEPMVLFLDEPFSALDEISRFTLQTLLVDLWTRHPMTIVFVTHSPQEAVFLSRHILIFGGTNPTQITETIEVEFKEPRDENLRFQGEYIHQVRNVQNLLRRTVL